MTIEPEVAHDSAEQLQRHSSRSVRFQRGLDQLFERWLSGVRGFVLAFLAFFLLAATWSISTPISAVPDEPAHMVKAAGVVRGQIYGLASEDVPAGGIVGEPQKAEEGRRYFLVPAEIGAAQQFTCNHHKVDQPQNCPITIDNPEADVWAVSSASLYNPTFYALVGWPSLIDTSFHAIYWMRLVDAALVSLFGAASVVALCRLRNRTVPVLTAALLYTPSIAFLGGAVNPNGLEVMSMIAFVSAVAVAIINQSRGRELGWLMALAAVSGVLLAETRSLGVIWLGVAVISLVIWAGWKAFVEFVRKPWSLVAVGIVAVGIALSLWQLATSNSLPSGHKYPNADAGWLAGFRWMVERVADFVPSMVGLFGWAAVASPMYVFYAFMTLAIALVVLAFYVRTPARQKVAIFVAFGSFVLLPAAIQAASMSSSGIIWQGRYSSAMLSLVLMLAALSVASYWPQLPLRGRAFFAGITVLSFIGIHTASYVTALHRHAVGISGSWGGLFTAPVWSPPLLNNFAYVALFVIVSAVFAVLMLMLSRPVAPELDRIVEGSAADRGTGRHALRRSKSAL